MNDMSNPPRTAKIFWSGRSQAVRLPKEFRFEGTEVLIRQEGGRVILEAKGAESDHDWIERIAGSWDEDAAAAALDRPGPESMPDGPSFD